MTTQHVDEEYFPHPRYTRYEVARDGTVRHRRLKQRIGIIGNSGYIQIGVKNPSDEKSEGFSPIKNYRAHRFIVETFYGEIPPGYVVDHIDRNKTNNHIDNLRIVTPGENCRNRNFLLIRVRRPVIAKFLQNFHSDGGTASSSRACTSTANSSITFPSLNSAEKYFDVNVASVKQCVDGMILLTWSKKFNCRVSFENFQF